MGLVKGSEWTGNRRIKKWEITRRTSSLRLFPFFTHVIKERWSPVELLLSIDKRG
jgi:hypothetical protein